MAGKKYSELETDMLLAVARRGESLEYIVDLMEKRSPVAICRKVEEMVECYPFLKKIARKYVNEYQQMPEQVQKRKERFARLEIKAKSQAYNRLPKIKDRKKKYDKMYRQRSGFKEKRNSESRERYHINRRTTHEA